MSPAISDFVSLPLVSLPEIHEIEIVVAKKIRELILGEHPSWLKGFGFDLAGIRDWQPGDPLFSIDWARSTTTNFSPPLVREFEETKRITILVLADNTLSARCGIGGISPAHIVARVIATLGVSAALFRDLLGLISFDENFRLDLVAPRIGRNHLIYCLTRYQVPRFSAEKNKAAALLGQLQAHLKFFSVVPFISDFIFPQAEEIIRALKLLSSRHDVFVILVETDFTFDLPDGGDGWMECFDVESKRVRLYSRRELLAIPQKVRNHQCRIEERLKSEGVDVLRAGKELADFQRNLAEFFARRRVIQKK